MIEKDSLYNLFPHFNDRKPNKKEFNKMKEVEYQTKKTEIYYQSIIPKSYYRDDNYKRVPVKVKIEYSKHAYERGNWIAEI